MPRIPRWVGLVVWPALLGTVHLGVPLELSRLPRQRRPSRRESRIALEHRRERLRPRRPVDGIDWANLRTQGSVVMRRAYAYGRILAFALVVALAGCTSNPDAAETAASVEPSVAPAASPIPTEQAPAFPTQAFADMSEDAVSRKVAAEFQAALIDMAGGGGMAATVMSPDGTWSGATGKADGVRDVRIHDQFAIASVTKPVVAAQVMQMVEAGEPTIASRVLTIIGPTVITLWVLVLGVLLVRKCREAA